MMLGMRRPPTQDAAFLADSLIRVLGDASAATILSAFFLLVRFADRIPDEPSCHDAGAIPLRRFHTGGLADDLRGVDRVFPLRALVFRSMVTAAWAPAAARRKRTRRQ